MFFYLISRCIEWFLGNDDPRKYIADTIRIVSGPELFLPIEDYWDVVLHGEGSIKYEHIGICLISIIANCSVLTHHLTHQPHPKFLIHRRRKRAIKIHIISGLLEMLCFVSVAAFRLPALALGEVLFCFVHSWSSFDMMSGLFGIRNVMAPCYFSAICVHVINGIRLLFQLKNPERAMSTFLSLQIYVWVRVVYAILTKWNIMTKYLYTLSVVLAGLTVMPSCSWSGLMANWEVFLMIVLWNGFRCPLCAATHPQLDDRSDINLNNREVNRESMVMRTHTYVSSVFSRGSSAGISYASISPTTAALATMEEEYPTISHSRSSCDLRSFGGSPTQKVNLATIQKSSSPKSISPFYNRFARQSSYEKITTESPYHTPTPKPRLMSPSEHQFSLPGASGGLETGAPSTTRTVSKVFASLCQNPEKGMVESDLERLLAVWGLPYKEAADVMRELGPKLADPDVISFEEFKEHLTMVWRYAKDILENSGQYHDKLRSND